MPGKLPKDIEVLFKKLYKNKEIPTVKPGSRKMRLGYPVLFKYDPKWKSILPYYDVLPMSIVLAKYSDGFLGINLHYLPWTRRLQLAKHLIRKTKNKNRVTYPDIKKAFKAAKIPMGFAILCLRRYLYGHVRSNMRQFDWDTYREAYRDIPGKFRKKSEKAVFAEMMRQWREKAGKK